MALVIENEELLRLAAEEAANRGITVSELVESALRKEIAPPSSGRAQRIPALVQRINENRPKSELSSDPSWLYDENGMPC